MFYAQQIPKPQEQQQQVLKKKQFSNIIVFQHNTFIVGYKPDLLQDIPGEAIAYSIVSVMCWTERLLLVHT